MSNFHLYYRFTYRRARDESKIDWHREEPPPLLVEAVENAGPGKAMDIGCGTGVYSVFMAQHGFKVTAIDFIPEALPFGMRRAEKAGVKADFVAADITKYENREKYNLILDAGCFHGFNEKYRRLYREKLLGWLAEGGQYVLVHFSKGHALGIAGPHGRKKEEIEEFFGPELKLENFSPELFGKPLSQYRFRRKVEQGSEVRGRGREEQRSEIKAQ